MPDSIHGTPRVTIVIPSFQQGRFLPSALRSVIAQDPAVVETRVFDNCSDDNTKQALDAFSAQLTSVTIERDEGQSSALNRGFTEARGDILTWLNADDILMPEAVATAIRAFDETGADIVYGHCAHLDAAGQFTGYFPYSGPYRPTELRDYNNFIPQPGTFFRRSLFDRLGPLDVSLHYTMDWDLWCRFARAGARFLFVPEVLAAARIHPMAKTSRGGLRRLLEISKVNSRHNTGTVPLVPLLYVAHRINQGLGLARIPRLLSWWRANTGGDRRAAINGVAAGPTIVSDPAHIRYPVYEGLKGLSVDLGDNEHPAASVVANGLVMARSEGVYGLSTFDRTRVESINISISGIHRPLPTPIRVLHRVLESNPEAVAGPPSQSK